MSWRILQGDCIEQMRDLPDESIDAIVTDPPYDLTAGKRGGSGEASVNLESPYGRARISTGNGGFMGKDWDATGVAFDPETWREALRVLKPGGHLLSFGGTRTYHRMVCAVEDAGFEIRDQIAWMFGSGFPKSLDVSKAIDKGAGHWRGRAGVVESSNGAMAGPNYERTEKGDPVTAAAAWSGWGTALKPAFEPIVVARKPLTGTVAANVLEHGTGAINVDGCRIETGDEVVSTPASDPANRRGVVGNAMQANSDAERNAAAQAARVERTNSLGRWPANVVLDPEAGEALDEQTGELVSGPESDRGHRRNADREASRNAYGGFQGQEVTGVLYGDRGGASRFFYCAKTSRAERNAGLDGFEPSDEFRTQGSGRVPLSKCPEHGKSQPSGTTTYACGCERVWTGIEGRPAPVANVHPTVKPIALMRWLVRLVTPPGGTILDPFNGSGSTGCAAVLEGFDYIGIDREPEYVSIAEARIKWWSEHPEGVDVEDGLRADRERKKVVDSGQLDIFGEAA